MGESDVVLRHVSKAFPGGVLAVDDISLDIPAGEFFALLGPSGCGKTTTLRMIAGFEQPTEGEILIRGKAVQGVPAFHRPVNTVFQDYALFPHMTALQNVMFGMEMRGVKKNAAKEKAQRALDMVQLPQVAARKPKQMSGGQQQRVALARALVNEPAVLLLDEPLGALDLKLRKQMQFELKDMQTRLGITFVFVTHDQEEALTMADRIAVLSDGKVLQVGTPSDIYENPVNRFVADFIGETNFLDGTLVEKTHESVEEFTVNDEVITGTLSRVKLRDGTVVEASLNDDTLAVDSPVAIALRPERIDVLPESGTVRGAGRAEVTVENALASIRAERNMNVVNGEIVQTVYIGTDTRYIIRLTDNTEVVVRQQNHGAGYDRTMESGESCYVVWDAENARVLAS